MALPVDPNENLRNEINAALDVVMPQIRGLEALVRIGLSPATEDAVMAGIAVRRKRCLALQAVVASLDQGVIALKGLADDGYPRLDPLQVVGEIEAEILKELADVEAAISVFEHPEMGDFNPQRSVDR